MNRTKHILLALLFTGAFLAACGEDDTNNDENGETGFSGGNFTVTVNSVDDGCFDGAMDSIVLPTGEPTDLPEAVSFPSYEDLPTDVAIAFNELFDDGSFEFEAAGDNGLKTTGDGFEQLDVDISATDEDECVADMMVTAELSATDDDNFSGTGTLSITETRGENCPALAEDVELPCQITTPMSATRN